MRPQSDADGWWPIQQHAAGTERKKAQSCDYALINSTVLFILRGEGVVPGPLNHQYDKIQFRTQIPLIERFSLNDIVGSLLFNRKDIAVIIQPAFLVFTDTQHHTLKTGGINIVPNFTGGKRLIALKVPLVAVGNFMQVPPVIIFRRQPEAAD